mmetsp:Transcript_93544/g.166414  ORF Transcript_93544/g.166414 Transcript_93544/m.166414 type:complete len:214 (-) Transcript_93544:917-1558(-)
MPSLLQSATAAWSCSSSWSSRLVLESVFRSFSSADRRSCCTSMLLCKRSSASSSRSSSAFHFLPSASAILRSLTCASCLRTSSVTVPKLTSSARSSSFWSSSSTFSLGRCNDSSLLYCFSIAARTSSDARVCLASAKAFCAASRFLALGFFSASFTALCKKSRRRAWKAEERSLGSDFELRKDMVLECAGSLDSASILSTKDTICGGTVSCME